MIGLTALPDHAPYFHLLLYGGIAAVVIGLLGLGWLFFKPDRTSAATTDERVTSNQQSGGITARNVIVPDDKDIW